MVLLGIVYPLLVTAIAQVLFPKKANGQLIEATGEGHWFAVRHLARPGFFIRGRRAPGTVTIH
jgi:K+-transporting ATPase ATPase C chain